MPIFLFLDIILTLYLPHQLHVFFSLNQLPLRILNTFRLYLFLVLLIAIRYSKVQAVLGLTSPINGIELDLVEYQQRYRSYLHKLAGEAKNK